MSDSVYELLLARLLQEHDGHPIVPLESVCDLAGLAPDTAKVMAQRGKLPWPAFRMRDSRKAPWMVNLQDVASHLASVAQAARQDWESKK